MQAADLSFVDSKAVLPPDGWVIEPGDAKASEVFDRITSTDPDLRMPPPEEHPAPLTEREVELIRRWIDQGARWDDQWSRTQLFDKMPPVTEPSQAWAKQALDHFVHAHILAQGLQPSPEGKAAAWLRRCSFDLIGLPPTRDELDRFLRKISQASSVDQREEIYKAEVDRLLASKHFGERWAAVWMDLARYADSKGFEKDPHRDIWPYRDWLIKAFNEDMPYDQFTISQLAGDLLPQGSYEDTIATAFHRNTQTNTEGGTDDEEFRMAAVIDRVNTTWTVWQATTFGCVQCHAHPYEPFDNSEYYASLALFNNSEDADLDSDFPTLPYLTDPAQQTAWKELIERQKETQTQFDALAHQAIATAEWQPIVATHVSSDSGVLEAIEEEFRIVSGTVAVGSSYTIETTTPELTALRIRILPSSDDPTDWPEPGSVLSHLVLTKYKEDGSKEPIEIELVVPDYRVGAYDCDQMLESSRDGFGGYPKLNQPRWVVAVLKSPLELQDGSHFSISIRQKSTVTGGRSNHLRRFKIESANDTILVQFNQTDEAQGLLAALRELGEERAKLKGPPVPVMKERSGPGARHTREFIRGNWLERGDLVQPGIPAIFQHERPLSVTNRLEFANWLVSKDNPLAARVWVNRVWAELFGIGIVETLEDFGISGQFPANRALLDHLALRMRDDFQWSLKKFLTSVVLSATYRQSNSASEALREQDPRNRWLARGPRTRLTAEMLRDQALVASGKLSRKIGGPSVMPPQPDGVWQQAYSSAKWNESQGDARFRRGLYTYWRRTSPYPGFIMFDTPTRDVCSPRRIATNTPLQALVTLNSRVFVELAQALAAQAKSSLPSDSAEPNHLRSSIEDMYVRVTSRTPSPQDIQDLIALYEAIAALRAKEALIERPPSPDASRRHAERLEPLAMVALAILNTDWALTK